MLCGDNAKHIIHSLRGRVGEQLVVCDKDGVDRACVIEELGTDFVRVSVKQTLAENNEPRLRITLFQGMPKSDKMELVIQKCTELGVHSIVPVITERTIVKPKDKSERFRKIAEAAAKQSMRSLIPEIGETLSLKEAVQYSHKLDFSLVAYENATDMSALKPSTGQTIGIFIGPEGGFSENEIRLMSENNIPQVSLGKRILRTETAGMVLITLLLYNRGDL